MVSVNPYAVRHGTTKLVRVEGGIATSPLSFKTVLETFILTRLLDAYPFVTGYPSTTSVPLHFQGRKTLSLERFVDVALVPSG